MPQEFFDLYPLDGDDGGADLVPLATNPYAPTYMPTVAYASWELESWGDVSATGYRGVCLECVARFTRGECSFVG